MQNGLISDSQISASSQWDPNHSPSNSRLFYVPHNGRTGAWSSRTNDANQWLQIDFRRITTIVEVSTQGRAGYYQYVKSYILSYGIDGVLFQFYKAHGFIMVNITDHTSRFRRCDLSGPGRVRIFVLPLNIMHFRNRVVLYLARNFYTEEDEMRTTF